MYIKSKQSYNEFVYETQEDISLKQLMKNRMGFSDRFVSRVKENALVSVNGKTKPKDNMLKKGDIVSVILPSERQEYEAEDFDFEILFEDDDIIIAEKPAGIAIHPTKGHVDGTFLNFMVGYFKKTGIKSKVRIITRLDLNTSGLVMVAKNSHAHHMYSQGSISNSLNKTYIALAEGIVEAPLTIDAPILRIEGQIPRQIGGEGKRAITHVLESETFGNISLLKIQLETGRTHQIRLHLAHINHPVFGDELYGGNMEIMKRQALHCAKLEFLSLREGKKKIIRSKSLPDDMKNMIEGAKNL